MAVLPRSLCWQRIDSTGIEHALFDDRSGLYARGTVVGTAPLAYSGSYELLAGQDWATVRLTVNLEGAGWLRSLKLERAAGRWHATAGEQGDLDAALMHEGHPRAELPGVENPDRLAGAIDVDLGYSPLTNTLPIRRLGLRAAAAGTSQRSPAGDARGAGTSQRSPAGDARGAGTSQRSPAGTQQTVDVAWVLVPSLVVVPAKQTYTVVAPGTIRYSSGDFAADLEVDGDGFVAHYPGLARLVTA
jgi:hypothetical protein